MLTELCVAVSSYASSGRWEHQQLSSGAGITRIWEGGNVAQMARICLNICVVRVVDSFRNNIFQFEGMEDVGIGHFAATQSVRWLNESHRLWTFCRRITSRTWCVHKGRTVIRSLFVDRSTSASEQYCLLDTRITAADGLRVTSQILYNNT